MTDEEQYLFDLTGYLVIKGVLDRARCGSITSTRS